MLLNLKSNALCPWVCVTPSKQKEFSFLVAAAAAADECCCLFTKKCFGSSIHFCISVCEWKKKQFQCCAGVLLGHKSVFCSLLVKFAQINCNITWHLKSNWKVNWTVQQAGPVIICDSFFCKVKLLWVCNRKHNEQFC